MLSSDPSRWRRLALAAIALSVGLAACGDDEDGIGGGGRIKPNPENEGVEVTIGSRTGTEREILAEVYSQALEAAGYTVVTDSDFGSEQEARQALTSGEISGYAEYLPELLSASGAAASDQDEATAAQAGLRQAGLVGFEPAPYSRTSAVGLLVPTAEKLKVEKISDLRGKAGELRFSGTAACESSPNCLAGIEDAYGLSFAEFVPADPVARYSVLDEGDAELSILETTDAPLFATPLHYTVLDDDEGVFPPGNPMFVSSPRAVEDAGPDFQRTIERVQRGLDLDQIRELNALVEVTGEPPPTVAGEYLQEFGYIPEGSVVPVGGELLQRE